MSPILKPILVLSIVSSLIALSGCSSIVRDRFHHEESSEQYSRVDKHSSFPAVRRVYLEQVNLVELIDPEGHAAKKYRDAWKKADESPSGLGWGLKYDLVLAYFREYKAPINPESARQHRNSVQDRILGVST
jgi:hypothetical protein